MRILGADGLEEGHGRQIARLQRGVEVLDVVLMIGWIGLADRADRVGRGWFGLAVEA